jgi:MFS family permease
LNTILRSNIWHLYKDVFWFGVLSGSAMAFLAVYASRLGATGFQVGLLTAGPAVANLVFSLPAGQWLQGRGLIRVSFLSATLHRLGYLFLIPLPLLFDQPQQIWMIILISLAMSVPGTILAIAFNAMFADVIPADMRGEVVGRRNALVAISLTVTSLLCGLLLNLVVFPLNYQIVFAIGASGAMLSTYYLGRLKSFPVLPHRVSRPLQDFARPGMLRFVDAVRHPVGLRFLTRAGHKRLLRLDMIRGPFGSFLFSYFLFYTFQFLSVPLFPIFFVRELRLSDGTISLGSALFHLAMLLASLRLQRLSARFGHRDILVYSALFYSVYPLLNAMAQGANLFLVASFLGGGVWAITNGGLVNRLMERVPENERPAHMALHNLALNMGILSGSLLGPVLGDWLGLRSAMLTSAGLRFLAGFLLSVWA